MSTISGRTSAKIFNFGQLFGMFPCTPGTPIPGVEELIYGHHPLPPMIIQQTMSGKYVILGEYSINLLHTAFHLYISATIPHQRRSVAGYTISAIIIEPGQFQKDVIDSYKLANII